MAGLASTDDRETRQREALRERLQRTLADLPRRQDNIMRQAQDCAPDDPFGHGLRQTYNDLETQRRTALAAVAELDAAEQTAPARPTAADAELLDALPYLTLNLTEAPDTLLRSLFEITRLEVRLHKDSDDVPSTACSTVGRTAFGLVFLVPFILWQVSWWLPWVSRGIGVKTARRRARPQY